MCRGDRRVAVASTVPEAIARFLDEPTPRDWLDEACTRLPEMLNDHANCELKAASTALGFLYRYPERTALAQRMSKLAREELRHFEQVRSIMDEMAIPFQRTSASRYAGRLRDATRPMEPNRLLDMLLVGALIEARSCERFAVLAPRLPETLGKFYGGLLASEARHFEHYIAFARSECGIGDAKLNERLAELKDIEATLISEADPDFRFHSGPPLQLSKLSP
ncbi:MAG: tRNA-(ms[2]io[6]A)-hydroxylase [Gammaproteobacteria bacterium]|nr:tRNA-(ms[2]io[6]A)-hydroxylase [Gammaproteobacteria bacterium]MBT8111478.1 tRNA-(ms[2]io[6]A)-hydroxylase [Gammaproteobacteria bacterium]NND46641.1 tRNA-(ms[2]io[6]A)-hydroxylase [Woeseiaceae bacterium]NNL46176.1 tRNA-(ms[2]io[6]A)-hydroxylase [Woeseiaceae bacterium]